MTSIQGITKKALIELVSSYLKSAQADNFPKAHKTSDTGTFEDVVTCFQSGESPVTCLNRVTKPKKTKSTDPLASNIKFFEDVASCVNSGEDSVVCINRAIKPKKTKPKRKFNTEIREDRLALDTLGRRRRLGYDDSLTHDRNSPLSTRHSPSLTTLPTYNPPPLSTPPTYISPPMPVYMPSPSPAYRAPTYSPLPPPKYSETRYRPLPAPTYTPPPRREYVIRPVPSLNPYLDRRTRYEEGYVYK